MVGMWCLLGSQLWIEADKSFGPGGISALGKKPHQERKEREKRGKIPGGKGSGSPWETEQSRLAVDTFQVERLLE